MTTDEVRNVTGLSIGVGYAPALRFCVSKIFGRVIPGEEPYPLPATMRAQRRFEGTRLIAPLQFLDAVALPVDYPLATEALDEGARQGVIERQIRFGWPPEIFVALPVSGPPVIARAFMPALAAARALELAEVLVRVTYV